MNFTAVLFVGGESRRMGADKATLIYEGEPLWARQLATLKSLSPVKIFISARTNPVWCPAEIEKVFDAPPACGPLSGLAAALENIRTTHLLVLAVDLPLMTTEHLRWLQSQARPGCGVMPVWCGQAEPLCAIYPAEAGDWARAALGGEDVSLKTLAVKLREKNLMRDCQLAEHMMRHYQNVNSPEDFSRFVRMENSIPAA